MKVEIWSDVVCPWCYIGKRRFEAALAQFEHADDVEVTRRSFELDPDAPRVQTEPHAERLARKYGVSLAQVEAMDARLIGEAKKEGLEFHIAEAKGGNTFDAHRLIHLAAARGLFNTHPWVSLDHKATMTSPGLGFAPRQTNIHDEAFSLVGIS